MKIEYLIKAGIREKDHKRRETEAYEMEPKDRGTEKKRRRQ